jgi:hypothetical protein
MNERNEEDSLKLLHESDMIANRFPIPTSCTRPVQGGGGGDMALAGFSCPSSLSFSTHR